MTFEEVAVEVAKELIRKSGVREYESAESRIAIANAAVEMAAILFGDEAVAKYLKIGPGTAKTIKNSGGDAAITLASLANGNGTSTGARQAVTLDLGALWAQRWRLDADFELAATPTAGYAIHLFGSYSNATGAGKGNTSGTDAAYAGYSNNIDAAVKHLEHLGSHSCTTQVTATVQKANIGIIFPKGRYLNLVVDNRSGAAFHSTDTNQVITLTPLEHSIEDTV